MKIFNILFLLLLAINSHDVDEAWCRGPADSFSVLAGCKERLTSQEELLAEELVKKVNEELKTNDVLYREPPAHLNAQRILYLNSDLTNTIDYKRMFFSKLYLFEENGKRVLGYRNSDDANARLESEKMDLENNYTMKRYSIEKLFSIEGVTLVDYEDHHNIMKLSIRANPVDEQGFQKFTFSYDLLQTKGPLLLFASVSEQVGKIDFYVKNEEGVLKTFYKKNDNTLIPFEKVDLHFENNNLLKELTDIKLLNSQSEFLLKPAIPFQGSEEKPLRQFKF